MKNPVKNKNNRFLLKGYLSALIATIAIGIISGTLITYLITKNSRHENLQKLKKESINIEKTIAEVFNYSNRINSYIGKQIAEHGANDLDFILKTFRQAETIQGKNKNLLSWSSFDWVDKNNIQRINSRVGLRKDQPDMSKRLYCQTARQNPWVLQTSFPVFGNPSESWVIPAGTGITDQNNNFLGIIVIGFNIDELTNSIERRIDKNISFVVIDDDLKTILQSKDNEIKSDIFFQRLLTKQDLKNDSARFDKAVKAENIDYLFYRKVEGYPYTILVGFNKSFLHKNFLQNTLFPIITLTCITLLFIIILFIFKSKILFLLNRERKLRNSIHAINISKTKLIRAASHDLKNYIFGICGLANLILENKKKTQIQEDEDLQMVQEISQQSEELMGFVEDLLDTNQSEDGEFNLSKIEICNITELTQRMVILNKNYAIKNHINLKAVNLARQKSLYIKCDIRRMKQILNNLISNSIKYSTANAEVAMETSYLQSSNEVCITVRDQGIGMTKEEVEMALLGKGQQIAKSENIDSHGIGMTIIKRLVDLHKGRMEIDSKKGYGTEVRLYFKAYRPSKTSIKKTEEALDFTDYFKNKTAILAEDDPVGNKVSTFLLRKMGFKVKHVENGKKILEQLEKHNFDIVFMDLNMPVLDGFATAKKIREGKEFARFKNTQIPIIAITADKPEAQDLHKAGIDAVLDKPFSEKQLVDLIMEYV